jgi:diaminohydroxyphosphoribosylaminopyrimidine deaminase / 5-amino-6-(5-phosphoribosylamino)uracil reductase
MVRSTLPSLDEAALRTLLAELAAQARQFRFDVAPNPCVGAAVLAGPRVVGRGFHEVWGQAHAEVRALDAAELSEVPSGGWDTLVVTLEPCSTRGKTLPCTELILKSGVRRVVVGSIDPDPRHRGRGIELLRQAGLEVELLEGAAPVEKTCPHFVAWTQPERLRRPRPWTIAKWAQTRTGQLRPPPEVGGGRWISGPKALDEVHVLRGRVDALVTGVQTVLADDPRFSVRPPGDPSHPPLRVVLDSYLRTPPEARLFHPPQAGEGVGELHLLCQAGASAQRHRALEDAGARITGLHANEADHIQLRDVQAWLWERGVRRVMLEAGPQLLERYLQQGFVDQVRVYTGPVNGGQGASMAPWLAKMHPLERLDRELDPDSVLEAFIEGPGAD